MLFVNRLKNNNSPSKWGVLSRVARQALSASVVLIAVSLVATPAALAKQARPDKPTGVTAEAGDGEVTLSWADPGDPETSLRYRYKALRSGDGYSRWKAAPTGATSITLRGLENGVKYKFQVRANKDGRRSHTVSVKAKPTAPPEPVVMLQTEDPMPEVPPPPPPEEPDPPPEEPDLQQQRLVQFVQPGCNDVTGAGCTRHDMVIARNKEFGDKAGCELLYNSRWCPIGSSGYCTRDNPHLA